MELQSDFWIQKHRRDWRFDNARRCCGRRDVQLVSSHEKALPTAEDIVLGVELEFAVINDPDAEVKYTSSYPVHKSYPKNTDHGYVHKGHGTLVQKIEELTDGFIRVGYDLTVGLEPDGFECYSQPGPFMDQLQAWSAFWDCGIRDHMSISVSGKTEGGNPKSCGMHVHVSGKFLTPITMANMLIFINNRENANFLCYIADRYDGHYCKIEDDVQWSNAMFLYHSVDCKVKAHRKKKILNKHFKEMKTSTYMWDWCCPNATQLHQLMMEDRFIRGALWAIPQDGTGDCEFRLFQTPTCRQRFFANLEFVHALVEYCHATGPREASYTKFCGWLMEAPTRRIRYTNLFKWLREANYVEGLIPRRKKSGGTTG